MIDNRDMETITITPTGLAPLNLREIAVEYIDRLCGPVRMPDAYAVAAEYYAFEAAFIRSWIDVREMPWESPYSTAGKQWADISRGRLYISNMHCEHRYWTVEQNVNYRIVHDYYDHRPLGAFGVVPAFTTAGELWAWNDRTRHRNARLPYAVQLVSFAETIGQLAYADVCGDFPPQNRVGFTLPQFNPLAPVIG